ncbi:M28 family metallopeptidase [Knoellia subterranea]|uniref:Aminopeptidase Y n=1 Tax=Knoellia subterranea KCTC 19937 TaxID=1385521 RepID=A0A0A0JMU1_9MICO|nr:M28 family metallopeptidase [Knoellia subterranea]KGN38453.1 aminopeptidase Y [Knoellia subterranea KCTC 19937]
MKKQDLTRALWLRLGAAAGGTALVLAASAPAGADPANNTSAKLRKAVTTAGVMEHLENLQGIADAHDGTRASGTPGYAASRDYVVDRLEAAGYSPTVQAFEFPFYRELSEATMAQVSPTAKTYANGTEFASMTYSGSGQVTAAVTNVSLTIPQTNPAGATVSGCSAAEFAGFPAGNIALIQRGTCTFGEKAVNAQAAGASAVVIMNEGQPGRTDVIAGTLGAPDVTIPVLGTSYEVGAEIASTPGIVLRIGTETESAIRTTWNVFAETAKGNPDNVVMAGAHLDSVVEGPGINDNGSGSAAILEVAEQFAKVAPKNKVRFAWWGAEELGLLGSEHYVADLVANDPEGLADIGLYLNFDMVGSPNYVRFVYDGDNSRFPVGPSAAEGPAGSGAIEDLFHDYFASANLTSEETPFSGRSDYGPFIEQGIPAGGLFTGAEGVKTAQQAAVFGGQAGVAYDVCYHQACDTLANVNESAIDENSDAIAHAVVTYAMSTADVNGGKGRPASPPGQHVDGTPVGAGTEGGGGLHDHDHGHGDLS